MGRSEMVVVLPERSRDAVSNGLRELTRALEAAGEDIDQGFGGLGGSYGYGHDFENETFMMHRFCWCEKDNCSWCGNEGAPNFHHKLTSLKVWWYKWIGRSMRIEWGEVKEPRWGKVLRECVRSLGGDNGPE